MTTAIVASSGTPADAGVAADATWRIEPLWRAADSSDGRRTEARPLRGGVLPPALAERYGDEFAIPLRADRPTIVANFVSTLDGVVAFDPGGPGGGRAVSGDFEPDRFLMGLLRATADAVLVGAGTVRAGRTRAWTADRVHPPSADAFADWRRRLGLAPAPTAIIVTASGVLDARGSWRTSTDQPVVVLTTERGAARLREDGPPGVGIVTCGNDERVPTGALAELLADRGFGLVLCEAGPTVFGELLSAGLVDELFLTLAPRVAGRGEGATRPGLVQGVIFGPSSPPTGRLRSVMRSGEHLFLRYGLGPVDTTTGGLS